ncbi:hypothetical protein WDW89_15515 [Deltaproteobacteria bacterium TL4]
MSEQPEFPNTPQPIMTRGEYWPSQAVLEEESIDFIDLFLKIFKYKFFLLGTCLLAGMITRTWFPIQAISQGYVAQSSFEGPVINFSKHQFAVKTIEALELMPFLYSGTFNPRTGDFGLEQKPTIEQAAESLKNAISFTRETGTKLTTIIVSFPHSELTATIANLYLEHFQEEANDALKSEKTGISPFVNQKLQTTEAKMLETQNQLLEFQKASDRVKYRKEIPLLEKRIENYNKQIFDLETRRTEIMMKGDSQKTLQQYDAQLQKIKIQINELSNELYAKAQKLDEFELQYSNLTKNYAQLKKDYAGWQQMETSQALDKLKDNVQLKIIDLAIAPNAPVYQQSENKKIIFIAGFVSLILSVTCVLLWEFYIKNK